MRCARQHLLLSRESSMPYRTTIPCVVDRRLAIFPSPSGFEPPSKAIRRLPARREGSQLGHKARVARTPVFRHRVAEHLPVVTDGSLLVGAVEER